MSFRQCLRGVSVGALLALAFAASSCRAPGESPGPTAVLRRQQSAWNRGDIDSFMNDYRRSPATSFSSASGTIRGWETVLERYRRRYPDRKAMGTLAFSEIEERSFGRRAAVVTGRWTLEREADRPSGVFTVVFERGEDGWKIVHDHTSAFPDVPAE